MKNNHIPKRLIGLGLILDIIILDQISKWLVLENILRPAMAKGEYMGLVEWITSPNPPRLSPISVDIFPFFNLVMVWNEGISFGMFQSGSPLVLIAISLVISVVFGFWLAKANDWITAIATGMIIGGALGNVIDRFRFGGVADFLDFHIQDWHFPAFNLADSCITIGIALLVIDGVIFKSKEA